MISVVWWFLFLPSLISAIDGKSKGKVAVKIVEEPAVYRGINTYYQQRHSSQGQQRIVTRVKEKPFTGPSHFKTLDGKCFVLLHSGYKYELCPFHNVTQKEESPRWNAFAGVLGVWHKWIIVNNTFQAMQMTEGDLCHGDKPRETKVHLKCGEENKIISVKEPTTCNYELVFHTPLACPLDSLLVYPALSPDAQKEWLDIEEGFYHQELTLQGYNKRRKKLFVNAGFLPRDGTEKQKETVRKPKGEVEKRIYPTENSSSVATDGFRSVEQCSEAYKKLLDEVEKLRQLLYYPNGPGHKNESHKNVQAQTDKKELYKDIQTQTDKKELYKQDQEQTVTMTSTSTPDAVQPKTEPQNYVQEKEVGTLSASDAVEGKNESHKLVKEKLVRANASASNAVEGKNESHKLVREKLVRANASASNAVEGKNESHKLVKEKLVRANASASNAVKDKKGAHKQEKTGRLHTLDAIEHKNESFGMKYVKEQ